MDCGCTCKSAADEVLLDVGLHKSLDSGLERGRHVLARDAGLADNRLAPPFNPVDGSWLLVCAHVARDGDQLDLRELLLQQLLDCEAALRHLQQREKTCI